jgi:tetratricopeptide (TPR) repeat protein
MPEIDAYILNPCQFVISLLMGITLLAKPAIATSPTKLTSIPEFSTRTRLAIKQVYLPYSLPDQTSGQSTILLEGRSSSVPPHNLAPEPDLPATEPSIDTSSIPENSNSRLDVLLQNLELVNSIEDEQIKVELLLELAIQFIEFGSAETGQELFSQALELIRSFNSAQVRVVFFLKASQQHEQIGQLDLAIARVNEALDSASTIDNAETRAIALANIAERYADLLEPALTANALIQAKAAAEQVDDSREQASIFAELAVQYADLGQYEQASQLIALGQQAIIDAEIAEANRTPLQPTNWAGNVGLAGNFFSGADRRGVFTFSAGAERQWQRDAFRTGLRLTYDVDSDRTDRDQFTGQFTTDSRHYFSNRLQYFVSTQVGSSDLENLQLGASLTTGVGINLWRATSDQTLDLQVGVGARYENFRDEDEDFDPISANFGLSYQDLLFDAFRIDQSFSVELPLGDLPDYLIQSQTNLRIPITNEWSFENLLRLTYTGEPADDNPSLIFNLQTGIRYDF